uniref:Rho guanine nucleotide exchange factor 40 n=1 Tax=Varanus komodoensis TaxID=61221 RepID=A0A8D2J3S9_VARKO
MCFQEPEPVEECVQSTLAALYPPFEATAPTLLSQVFEVLERTYQHDALRYTLDFLVPAKHILARIQSEACAQYSGFVFCHEGWPLCLREKILVQLGSLPWQRLCPGDFYLQVVPHRECAPRLVLKCLAPEGRGVQELPVSPESYPFLFTVEWLNGVNKERRAGCLERCLLAAGEQVLSLPWPELVYPQFVHKDGFIVGQRCPLDLAPEVLGARSPGDGRHSGGENRESEGEYVHLLEVSPTLHQPLRTARPCGAQIQTMPARKGHGKSRSRRHRAWLHHKSGYGENFALRQASRNSSPGQLEHSQGPCGTKARPAIFGAAAFAVATPAAAEDPGLGQVELSGSLHQDPGCPSSDSQTPASATPKRTAKGNRRKKKGAGRGASGRIRQGADLAGKEVEASANVKEVGKEETCIDAGEQESGKGESSTKEQAAGSEECFAGITDGNSTQEQGSFSGEQSIGTGEESVVGTGELSCSGLGRIEPVSNESWVLSGPSLSCMNHAQSSLRPRENMSAYGFIMLPLCFASPGGMDRAGRSLLTVVPQPIRDELPPRQEVLVRTLRYLHSLLSDRQAGNVPYESSTLTSCHRKPLTVKLV